MTLFDYASLFPSISAIISGVLALIVTLRPPVTMKGKYIWIGIFSVIAIVAIGATFWLQYQNNRRDEDRKNTEFRKESEQKAIDARANASKLILRYSQMCIKRRILKK